MTRGPATPAPVWGRDDLTCPVPGQRIQRLIRHAHEHPWQGNQALDCGQHVLNTTAITEPGKPTRVLFSLDYGYHQSGWFANSDYERCLHLSVSHPRPDRLRLYPAGLGNIPSPHVGIDLEAPTEEETRAWGRVLFGEHHTMARYEPPVGPMDPYRSPGVAHLRLHLDQAGNPIMPRGEVYHPRPFEDGSSPAKVTEGRLGADVR